MRSLAIGVLIGSVAVFALACESRGQIGRDGGAVDASTGLDGGATDGGPDAGFTALDGGERDAGLADAGPPDAGWRFNIEEDPECRCGYKTDAWNDEMQTTAWACPCFAMPRHVFECGSDSECVPFDPTCMGCRRVPRIAVHRAWAACLEAYKGQYCGRYEGWGNNVVQTCCTFRCADEPNSPECRPRCVDGRCWLDVPGYLHPEQEWNCTRVRNVDGGGVDPYPYPYDGGPYARCGE